MSQYNGLDVESWIDAGRAVVEVRGELDAYTVPRLRTQFLDLTAPSCYRVAVEMSGLSFTDSSGLGVLIAAAKRAKAGGGRLVLVCPGPNIVRMLEVTGLRKVLPVCGNLEDAFAALA